MGSEEKEAEEIPQEQEAVTAVEPEEQEQVDVAETHLKTELEDMDKDISSGSKDPKAMLAEALALEREDEKVGQQLHTVVSTVEEGEQVKEEEFEAHENSAKAEAMYKEGAGAAGGEEEPESMSHIQVRKPMHKVHGAYNINIQRRTDANSENDADEDEGHLIGRARGQEIVGDRDHY